KYAKHAKIRLGYFSPDFRPHPLSYLTVDLFEKHDRSKFEIFAFYYGNDSNSNTYRRIKWGFDRFFDVGDRSDKDVAEFARENEIDIAIDLCGYTRHGRSGIFSFRAAPIQINFLGFGGTMGADFIDYIIADRIVIDETMRRFYAEKIAYLPYTYYPTSYHADIFATDRQFKREEVGLPDGSFVFCCFNGNYKLTPRMFDSWMNILRSVEGSLLWLLPNNTAAAINLRKEANKRGVDDKRLIFASRMPLAEHIARYKLADLFLDTIPYNAHTTASDALWAGLPVLTQIGDTFAGRVAASLLTAVGLPELITDSAVEYETLAVELAKHPERLAGIKTKLAANRLTTPLFDTDLFTKKLETAYTAMYERYHTDLPPDHIFVEP
ncbi:MAG TPA: UDP-N-acetylglucosamine-peptide N-acetylglucosaminyltransferase, partial [Methylobacter sp.]